MTWKIGGLGAWLRMLQLEYIEINSIFNNSQRVNDSARDYQTVHLIPIFSILFLLIIFRPLSLDELWGDNDDMERSRPSGVSLMSRVSQSIVMPRELI